MFDPLPNSKANPNPSGYRTSNSETATGSEDTALLSRVGQGDESAMETVFRRYSGAVYSVALRVLHDSGQAEDVMQEIFLQLWRKPAAFVQGRGALGAWLVVVTRNRAIDLLRRRKLTDSVDDVVLASPINVADEAERNAMMEKVRGVLNTRAEAVTGCDNSCLMHIGGALHRERTGVRPVHIAEILASEEGGQR